ncbi:(Dimethylallyl)adenosine tRNA methylthiotransferase MiaB [Clostridium sp. CAG:1219]|nr:(Dimethylallyl)adenosine tRNA methylthiotransferase MiaB [Clostridium sp. CAG:1219]
MRFTSDYTKKIKENINGKNMTYYIDTMGCQMNENDSLKYAGIFENMGFKKSESEDDANIVLFNTCCVRENAENTLFGRLGFLKNRKSNKKDFYIVVVGCMTQQKHIIEKIINSYNWVDVVLGTNSMQKLPRKLYNAMFNKKDKIEYYDIDNEIIEGVPVVYNDKYKASVSIIYGCNNFCSYCIVPYVRGREHSRKIQDIVNDVEELAQKGYKEIMLLGQNVNSYGNDLKDETNFPKLLREIEKIDGIEIIRFMSPHPKDFSDELIDTIAKSTKIARQIHLPLQSGSTKILKEMNRKYTKEDYLKIVEKLKKADGNISFSTDIIVGFPGETREDFEETLDVVKRVEYDQIYMFIYSKREGTVAANIKDDTKYEEKVDRLEELKHLYESNLPKLNKKYIGTIQKVLVEGKSKNNDKLYTGRTSSNKTVIFEAADSYIGTIQKIKIISEHLWYLKGKIDE